MKETHNLINNKKIKVALVGCGRISKIHLIALKQNEAQAELVGICDIDPEALQKAAKETGTKPYANIPDLLKYSDADAVILTTPSGLHSEQAIEVAESGRHVICEKPVANRWQDAIRMIKACEKARVHLFVVKQNRFNPMVKNLKQAIDQGRFGKIYLATANIFWTRPQDYYDAAAWRGTWKWDGGAFMNQGSHYVDLLSWLVGPVESVHAYAATLARKIEAEDTGVLSLKWRSGALGSVNITMLTYPENLEGSLAIFGEKGTVRLGGQAMNEIQTWKFADSCPEDETVKTANYQPFFVSGAGHSCYYESVFKFLKGQAQPVVDGREGLKSLELLVAAQISAREGKRVLLPLEL